MGWISLVSSGGRRGLRFRVGLAVLDVVGGYDLWWKRALSDLQCGLSVVDSS
jgi:hypothetical protein